MESKVEEYSTSTKIVVQIMSIWKHNYLIPSVEEITSMSCVSVFAKVDFTFQRNEVVGFEGLGVKLTVSKEFPAPE